MRAEVLELARRISDLLDSPEDHQLEDLTEAEDLAYEIKPYVDRLVTLQRLLRPVQSIANKRDQIADLQQDLAKEAAEIEGVKSQGCCQMESLNDELAELKDDRKILVQEIAEDDKSGSSESEDRGKPSSLLKQPVAVRMQRIFQNRFVGLDQLVRIFKLEFIEEEVTSYEE